jgi:Flp pilus assembly protein TadD
MRFERENRREKKSFQRRIFALFVLALICTVGTISARRGLSHYLVYKAVISDSELSANEALNLNTSNPDAHKTRGLMLSKKGEYREAFEHFDRALSLRENDYLLWLRRGFTRYKLGDFAGAESDYRQAVALAPEYAQPYRYLGRLLLKENRFEEAFSNLSRAAELDDSLMREVLHLARKTYPGDAAAIERAVAPKTPEAKKRTALYLIKYNMTAEAVNLLTSGDIGDKEANDLIDTLISSNEIHLAFDVWKKKYQISPTAENLLLDGDFEEISTESDAGFGWQINQDDSKVNISINSKEGFSGSRGLHLQFEGDSDPNAHLIWQLIPVTAGKNYRLTFAGYSEDLVTGGAPFVAVLDAAGDQAIAESTVINNGKGEWRQFEINFTAPDRSEGVIVGIKRRKCKNNPCPAFGSVYFDNFDLREIN